MRFFSAVGVHFGGFVVFSGVLIIKSVILGTKSGPAVDSLI